MFPVQRAERRVDVRRRNLSPLPLAQQLVTNLPGLVLRSSWTRKDAGFTEPSTPSMFSSAVSRCLALPRAGFGLFAHTYASRSSVRLARVCGEGRVCSSVLTDRAGVGEPVLPQPGAPSVAQTSRTLKLALGSQNASLESLLRRRVLLFVSAGAPTPNATRRTGDLRRRTRCLHRRRKNERGRPPPPRKKPPLPAPHRARRRRGDAPDEATPRS